MFLAVNIKISLKQDICCLIEIEAWDRRELYPLYLPQVETRLTPHKVFNARTTELVGGRISRIKGAAVSRHNDLVDYKVLVSYRISVVI